jgi:FixJ family two-component response regulator
LDLEKLQIILVDDSQADLDAQRRTLDQCKLLNEVHSFKAGAAFLDFLRSGRGDGSNDRYLVFLDLVMKPDDGITVLEKIHEEKLAEGSIIVMLSGLTDVKLLHQGYQLGAHTFLVKPLKVEDVMELVSSLKHSISVIPEQKGNRLGWSKPFIPAAGS